MKPLTLIVAFVPLIVFSLLSRFLRTATSASPGWPPR